MQHKSFKSRMNAVIAGFIALTVCLLSQVASAVPLYLSFSGNVDHIYDSAGIAATAGVGVGDSVNYTYMVDTDLPGEVTLNNGAEYALGDNWFVDSFYADFVGGSLIESEGEGYFNSDAASDYFVSEYNYGLYLPYFDIAYILGESMDDRTSVFSISQNPGSIGSSWRGLELAFNEIGQISVIGSLLQLTGISSSNPYHSVPEIDAAGALIAFSLMAGLLAIRMERRLQVVAS